MALGDSGRDADALRATHGRLPATLRSQSSILIALDRRGVVLLWNAAAERVLGISEAAVIGSAFVDTGIAWDWGRIGRLAPGGISARSQRIIQPFTRSDGAAGVITFQVDPQYGPDRTLIGCVWLGSDSSPAGGSMRRGAEPTVTRPAAASQRVWRTPAPDTAPPSAATAETARLYPVHLSFLDGHLVAHGEDLADWRILHAVETRLDEQGMEVCFTLARRYPAQGILVRRILVASGELIAVSES